MGKVTKKASPYDRKSFSSASTTKPTTCDVANTTSYKKSPRTEGFTCGLDGTRTRDPLRDRQIF